jgi:LPPG:FO 2-phospho-L-lactate transferase
MNFLVLSGGVGGAKFADGMAKSVGAENLTVVVNTADDHELYGLHISPDLDSVMYALAGVNNEETGWGLADESWNNFEMLQRYGAEPWFRLGDKDLATHFMRTGMLRNGATLTEVTRTLAQKLGVRSRILPMTDARVRTIVDTDEGLLPFQEYFVKRKCEPAVNALIFEGAEEAEATVQVVRAIETADTIIIAPSNPYMSIDPILALQGVKDALFNASAPIIAISPIVGGLAVKGPLAKVMAEQGQTPTPVAIAEHYADFINGFVLDEQDRDMLGDIVTLGLGPHVTNTIMNTPEDRASLACEVVNYADKLRPERLGGCELNGAREPKQLSAGR